LIRTNMSVAVRCLAAGLLVGIGLLIRANPAAATKTLNVWFADDSDRAWCEYGTNIGTCGGFSSGQNSSGSWQCQAFSAGGTVNASCPDSAVQKTTDILDNGWVHCTAPVTSWGTYSTCNVPSGGGHAVVHVVGN
jgi:hypothetical protein